jgi:exodeoxyribonuclease VII small subunit
MTKETKKESFEAALKKLEECVRSLESGEKGLEESLAVFEKGVGLARDLGHRLEEAKQKVEALVKDGGSFSKKSLHEEALEENTD